MGSQLADQLARFEEHLRSERRLSPHTVNSYLRDLNKLADWCAQQQLMSAAALTSQHVRRCMSQLHHRGLGGRSLQRWLSSLRTFFNYALKHQWVRSNPSAGIAAPKAPKKLPHTTLDVDQTSQFVSTRGDGWIDCRDRAMIELFYSSGLRLSELTPLNLTDLDFADQLVRVTGKGGKTRQVPVGSHAIAALRSWLTRRSEIPSDDQDAVFISARGRRIAPRTVQERLRLISLQQGMQGKVHPPYAAPFLCQPPAGIQRRPARHTGAVGPCQPLHHPDLCPPGFPAPVQNLRPGPPARQTEKRPRLSIATGTAGSPPPHSTAPGIATV
ncbi:tyrosine-type recombinase/integrase [Porticoccus sp.]